MEIVEEVNEKDEIAYETYINGIIDKLLEVCEEIDPKLKEKLTELLSIEDSAIKTFHMDLMANVRGENHLSNLDLRMSKQKVIFGELLRSFIERMSVGFVNIRVSCVIWDYILLKTNKNRDDLFVAFAVLLNIIKQDVYSSANVLELEKAFREKSQMIDDYDYFWELFEFGKDKDWRQSFTLPDGDSLRQNFISLDKVKESNEEAKRISEDEQANSREIDQKQRADKFNEFNTFQNPTYDHHNSMMGSQKDFKATTMKPEENNYSMINGARRSQTKF